MKKMKKNNSNQTINEHDTLQSIVKSKILQMIYDTEIDARSTSKEKYIAKQKLIESDNTMTTQEKLDAMDRNYKCINQEYCQIEIRYAVISVSVVGLAIVSPVVIKYVRKFLQAT